MEIKSSEICATKALHLMFSFLFLVLQCGGGGREAQASESNSTFERRSATYEVRKSLKSFSAQISNRITGSGATLKEKFSACPPPPPPTNAVRRAVEYQN